MCVCGGVSLYIRVCGVCVCVCVVGALYIFVCVWCGLFIFVLPDLANSILLNKLVRKTGCLGQLEREPSPTVKKRE